MAAPTLLAGRTLVRLWAQDSSASLQGMSDPNINLLINDKYMTWYRLIEQRAQRVTLSAEYLQGALEQQTDATATYPEILSVALGNVDSQAFPGFLDRSGVLERCEWSELQDLQLSDPTPAPPKRYAMFKAHGAAETWTIGLHPIPDAIYNLIGLVRVYPAPLVNDGDVPELGDAEGYWLYRLAAAEVAYLDGAPELVENILTPIPDNIRGLMGVSRTRIDPKRRPEESVL